MSKRNIVRNAVPSGTQKLVDASTRSMARYLEETILMSAFGSTKNSPTFTGIRFLANDKERESPCDGDQSEVFGLLGIIEE